MGGQKRRGKLKVFLGYAAGVGKTYQMLVEAHRLKEQGCDTVIAYFEPHGRKETIAQTEGLEFVPRKLYEHRGASFKEMDTDAVLARNPQVAAIDEFAHTNVPGSPRNKRWEDVLLILDAGIDVLTSLNVQHIESLNDQVWHVTGVRVRELVPDWAVQEADEMIMVDVTPRALLHRLERGVVYTPEKARVAIQNFFTEANLNALRELALRQTAHQLEDKREEASVAAVTPEQSQQSGERIMLWITPHRSSAALIRRGRRIADYLGCSCTAVYLAKDAAELKFYLNSCGNLRIGVQEVGGKDAAREVALCARQNGVTQIFVTRHAPAVDKLVNFVRDMQVTVVAERVRPESK